MENSNGCSNGSFTTIRLSAVGSLVTWVFIQCPYVLMGVLNGDRLPAVGCLVTWQTIDIHIMDWRNINSILSFNQSFAEK